MNNITRRQFLKTAGLTTIMGLGGYSLVNAFEQGSFASETEVLHRSLTAKRWGMVIDVDKLKTEADYQKCIDACHRVHNVPAIDNPKHEIKWIWTETYEHTFPGKENKYLPEHIKHKNFLLLCNHCEKPPCVRVCPTKATFKRKEDGIVAMDMHRCIGCRFCMAACPYGVRSFNWIDPRPHIKEINPHYPARMRGVVEKCNFCPERLVKGQLPACVEACEDTKALVFGDLEDPDSEVRQILKDHYTIQRKPELGTHPSVYYVIGGKIHG
jgi:Fe-S-cluster-containing dehydrogenase component